MILYLPHNEIDKKKWDLLISSAFNSRPYGLSWFLDIVSPGWDALVEDDYLSVFPLTFNKKVFINYLFQPFFTQQLGVFSREKINPWKVNEFLDKIPGRFQYIEIQLNSENILDNMKGVTLRKNHELDLSSDYDQLKNNYNHNTKRNLKKAMEHDFQVSSGVSISEIITLFRNTFGDKEGKLSEKNYSDLQNLAETAVNLDYGETYGIYSDEELIAAVFLLKDHLRYIFHTAGSSAQGKESGAMFHLIDYIIKIKSSDKRTFDFEGSDNDNVSRLYKGFGAIEKFYPLIRINRLPWYIKPLVIAGKKIRSS